MFFFNGKVPWQIKLILGIHKNETLTIHVIWFNFKEVEIYFMH